MCWRRSRLVSSLKLRSGALPLTENSSIQHRVVDGCSAGMLFSDGAMPPNNGIPSSKWYAVHDQQRSLDVMYVALLRFSCNVVAINAQYGPSLLQAQGQSATLT